MRERTQQEHGHNHVRWMRYWIEDFIRRLAKTPRTSGEYAVGETLAPTPGDAVMRNDLVELIRYRPTTTELRPEPILIVPAWIMKYYILDLTAQRSLVAYLRDQGFEVFIPSWNTPDEDDADLSMQDYIDLGVGSAVGYIKAMGGGARLHAAGYCLGGTLLAIATAAMSRDDDHSFASRRLLAAQTEFSEPGELGLFINESQVAFLGDILASRMPARMHSEYLRQLFLGNNLANGRLKVDDKAVALSDIRADIYCVATEAKHVSP